MEYRKDTGMTFKLLGVILIVFGCGGVGFKIASSHRMEEKALRELIRILDFMQCELQYRLTSFPELCEQAAKEFNFVSGKVFNDLTLEIEKQIVPDIARCMNTVLDRRNDIPPITCSMLKLLGASIGRFDLAGQLKGLESARQECRRNLEEIMSNRDIRLRSYQTLGLCAGAALAILLI